MDEVVKRTHSLTSMKYIHDTNIDLTRLDPEIGALSSAVHQQLPTEILDEVVTSFRAAQLSAREIHPFQIAETVDSRSLLFQLQDRAAELAISRVVVQKSR